MKKILWIVPVAFIICCLLASCGGGSPEDVTAAQIMTAISEGVAEGALPELIETDSSMLEKYYGLTDTETAEFSGQVSLLNVTATELLIVRAQKNAAEAVVSALETRRTELKNTRSGMREDQYKLIEDCRIVRNGNWILFSISTEADDIVRIFNGYTDK